MGNVSRSLITSVAALAGLSGCAPLPQLTHSSRLPVAATIRHVNCEMREAFYGPDAALPDWFKPDEWSVSVELTMQADNAVDAGVGYRRAWEYSPVRTLTLGLGAAFDQKGHRDSFVGYSRDLADLKALDCGTLKTFSRGQHPLAGSLGIAAWRDSSIAAYDSFAKPDKLRYGTQFRVTAGASAEPVVTLTSITKSFSGAIEQTNDDTISLAFSKKPPKSRPQPIPVFVVNSPAGDGKTGAPPVRTVPRPAAVPRSNGVDPETQQRLDEIQNKGVLQRSLPRCRSEGIC